MRQLLLLRHAKSSWDHPELRDHERPLNRRGLRDAPRIGRLLAEREIVPEAILSSTAVRAVMTAELVAEACGFVGEIERVPELYGARPCAYVEAVRELGYDREPAMVVGHNPGLESLVELLSGESERMPTAALARVEFEIDDWRDFVGEGGRLRDLWRPKELPV